MVSLLPRRAKPHQAQWKLCTMIQNGLVSAMLKWLLGRADFHVRHGAGVRQFIEVAQKFAGEVVG